MAANSAFNSQGASTPAPGGYIQPSPGVTGQIVTLSDVNGNAYQVYVPAGTAAGLANLQTAQYRDCAATVQAGSKASAPSAGGTVVSITPGVTGLWEITGTLGLSGTTAVATDTNNFALNVGTVASIAAVTYPVLSTTGAAPVSIPATILSLTASSVVNVTAVANSTASSVYSATLVARRVG